MKLSLQSPHFVSSGKIFACFSLGEPAGSFEDLAVPLVSTVTFDFAAALALPFGTTRKLDGDRLNEDVC